MAYTRVNWENLPSTNTPVNATNLNKMDAGIANAVEKTGDTLTGSLYFNNADGYDAIRKKRTIDGVDYELSVGLGGNKSARLEFSTGGQSLSYVEARTDGGIYNGKTNKKLAEQSTGWTNVTLSSYLRGTVKYTKIGNIVIVHFHDVVIQSDLSHGVVLASGLPKSTDYLLTVLNNYDNLTALGIRIGINTSGQIVDHYSTNAVSNSNYYGTLIYITNE